MTVNTSRTVVLPEVRKPAYAVAGLADLAIEQVKDAPAAYFAEVRKAQERLAEVPSVVKTIPTQVKDLRVEVGNRVAQATEQAGDLYTALALRGQRLVTQIRLQPAPEAAIDEGKEAVRKAQAAAVAALHSARAGERAVSGAATKIG